MKRRSITNAFDSKIAAHNSANDGYDAECERISVQVEAAYARAEAGQ